MFYDKVMQKNTKFQKVHISLTTVCKLTLCRQLSNLSQCCSGGSNIKLLTHTKNGKVLQYLVCQHPGLWHKKRASCIARRLHVHLPSFLPTALTRDLSPISRYVFKVCSLLMYVQVSTMNLIETAQSKCFFCKIEPHNKHIHKNILHVQVEIQWRVIYLNKHLDSVLKWNWMNYCWVDKHLQTLSSAGYLGQVHCYSSIILLSVIWERSHWFQYGSDNSIVLWLFWTLLL